PIRASDRTGVSRRRRVRGFARAHRRRRRWCRWFPGRRQVSAEACAEFLPRQSDTFLRRLNAEPAVGSTPPWAGVTPAPSIKRIAKWRGRHFALSFFGG